MVQKQISWISNKAARIKFIGKSGVLNECVLKDKKVVDMLHQLYHDSKVKNNAPLFSYTAPSSSERIRINAKDVNNYLKTFGNFTTKYFRTWVANVTFIDEIMSRYKSSNDLSLTARKKIFRDAIESTAKQLYHTPAICKKSYVSTDLWNMFIKHPTKFDRIITKHYKSNKLLDASENAFINFLQNLC